MDFLRSTFAVSDLVHELVSELALLDLTSAIRDNIFNGQRLASRIEQVHAIINNRFSWLIVQGTQLVLSWRRIVH